MDKNLVENDQSAVYKLQINYTWRGSLYIGGISAAELKEEHFLLKGFQLPLLLFSMLGK